MEKTEIKHIREMSEDKFIKFRNHCIEESEEPIKVPVEVLLNTYYTCNSKTLVASECLVEILNHTEEPMFYPRLRLPFFVISVGSWILIDLYEHFNNLDFAILCFTTTRNNEGIIPIPIIISNKFCWEYDENTTKEISLLKKILYYLNSEKADIEEHQYKGKALKKVQSNKISPIVYIGRKYKGLKGLPTGIKIDKRFVVRGHWRKQPTKDGVKIIFIEPYYKGTDDMEEILKNYVVTKGVEDEKIV